jgi:hypothetical protein
MQWLGHLALVFLITVLLWLLAEGRTVRRQSLECELSFVSPPGQQLVIEPQRPTHVQIELECSDRQFDQLAARARRGPFEVEVYPDPEQPVRELEPVSLVGELELFKSLRPRVIESQPTTVDVRVERRLQRELPVRLVNQDAPVVDYELNPDRVQLSLPASLAESLGPDVAAQVSLTKEDLNQYAQDGQVELRLPVVLPTFLRGPRVRFEPTSVRAVLEVRRQTRSIALTRVPIHVNAPWQPLSAWAVIPEGEKLLLDQDVRIEGPTEVIERIEANELRVWAELVLTAEFMANGVNQRHTRPVQLRLPERVRLTSAVPTVTFTIKSKASLD